MEEKTLEELIKEANNKGIKPEKFAFAYARLSTDPHRHKTSAEEQVEKRIPNSREDQALEAQSYAEENELYLLRIYSATESAFKEGRVCFQQMLADSKKYGVKNIIFKNTDRLSRNDIDWPATKRLVKDNGYQIHLYEYRKIFNSEASAEDEMFLDNTQVFAKYWSRKISQGVKRAYINRVERKGIASKNVLGYRWNYEKSRYEIDEEKEEAVRLMFDLYDNQKYSPVEIAEILNSKGYTTRRNVKFCWQTVYRVLINPFYCGHFLFKGKLYEATHTAYITKAAFDERRRIMAAKFKGRKQQDTNYLFSRYVKCQDCGRTFTGRKINKKFVYYSHNHPLEDNKEKSITHREDRLLQLVDEEISKFAYNESYSDFLKYIFENSVQSKSKSHKSKKEDNDIAIKKLERNKARILSLFADEKIEKDELYEKLDELKNEINQLKSYGELLEEDLEEYEFKVIEVIDYLRKFCKTYFEATPEDRIKLLKSMAFGIEVGLDNSVNILWKKPFNFILSKDVVKLIPYSPNNSGTITIKSDCNYYKTADNIHRLSPVCPDDAIAHI